MDLCKLDKILADEPAYRRRQVRQAVFKKLIGAWPEASSLPARLRDRLEKEWPLAIRARVLAARAGDAVKAALYFSSRPVETVLMRHADGRRTVCVSSQLGCPLACAFCATGRMGLVRNLTAGEIADQVLFFSRRLRPQGEKVTNVVFMGMGEPFLNYEEVRRAIGYFCDPDLFGLSARRLAVSTVGIGAGLKRFIRDGLAVNLAFSLHAADNETRSRLLPINRTEPMDKMLGLVRRHIEATGRRAMIEYVLLKGMNDSPRDARKLAELLPQKLGRLFFINLIDYNRFGAYRPSPPVAREQFKKILKAAGLTVVERYRFGRDIRAACGQLSAGAG